MTNKDANGKKGTKVAIEKGIKAQDVIDVLKKILMEMRNMVKEVTLDMAGRMNLIAKECFPKTEIVTDRFYVQKLASEAVQKEHIRLRWKIREEENKAIEQARGAFKALTQQTLLFGYGTI